MSASSNTLSAANGWYGRARAVHIGLLLPVLLLCPKNARALSIAVGFDRVWEYSDCVCVGVMVADVPAAEPSPESPRTYASYRVRVTHVWKGNPPDTLDLGAGRGRVYDAAEKGLAFSIVCGGPPQLIVGKRYLIFASEPNPRSALTTFQILSHTREVEYALDDLLRLQRQVGPAKKVLADAPDPPDVSWRLLTLWAASEDVDARSRALVALRELGDSSGVALNVLERLAETSADASVRGEVSKVLSKWAPENEEAEDVFLRMLRDPDADDRLSTIAAIWWPHTERISDGVLSRIRDADPRVRAAALRLSAHLLSKDLPPTHWYFAALDDAAWEVRSEAASSLGSATSDTAAVRRALVRAVGDLDSRVSASAGSALERLRSWQSRLSQRRPR